MFLNQLIAENYYCQSLPVLIEYLLVQLLQLLQICQNEYPQTLLIHFELKSNHQKSKLQYILLVRGFLSHTLLQNVCLMLWFVQIAVYPILQKNMTFAVIANLPTKLNDTLFDVVILCLIIWELFYQYAFSYLFIFFSCKES